jgi:hypothetical protein
MSIYDYFLMNKNPFLMDIEDKQVYTVEDYVTIQEKMTKHIKKIESFIDFLYPETISLHVEPDEFKHRCLRTLKSKIIDMTNPVLPEIKIYKIGNGGNEKNCFVSCTALLDSRYTASQTMLQSLEEVGFNGYFLLLNGGFPNPSGVEGKYVGVPYSFKIFMMLEAKKRGFEKVIWLDSGCYAVNNPDNLFNMLEENDVLFRTFPPNLCISDSYSKYCYPKTLEYISNLMGRNVKDDMYVCTIVFGLNFNSEKVMKFISEYYTMVELGLPFLTFFPEEIVISSIMNKPEYNFSFNDICYLYIHECYVNKMDSKNSGFYFCQRGY